LARLVSRNRHREASAAVAIQKKSVDDFALDCFVSLATKSG
jgi:hypothetical protein